MPLPHRMAPNLMDNLFNWMNDVKEEGIIERVGYTPNNIIIVESILNLIKIKFCEEI